MVLFRDNTPPWFCLLPWRVGRNRCQSLDWWSHERSRLGKSHANVKHRSCAGKGSHSVEKDRQAHIPLGSLLVSKILFCFGIGDLIALASRAMMSFSPQRKVPFTSNSQPWNADAMTGFLLWYFYPFENFIMQTLCLKMQKLFSALTPPGSSQYPPIASLPRISSLVDYAVVDNFTPNHVVLHF